MLRRGKTKNQMWICRFCW
jgi:serine/threonine protein kinase